MNKVIGIFLGILLIGISGCVWDSEPKPPVVSPTVINETSSITNGPTLPSKIPWWVDEKSEEVK